MTYDFTRREIWTLTLREEQRLMVFENKILRKIFGAKGDEVTGEWKKLHNAELHAFADNYSIKHTTMRVLLSQKIPSGIPLPPQPVLTRLETWLDAVNYYAEYYGKIMEVIYALDSTNSSAVAAVKSVSSEQLLEDILFIDSNFKIMSKSITLLESSELQLSEALNIVYEVSQTVIQNNNSVISEKSEIKELRQPSYYRGASRSRWGKSECDVGKRTVPVRKYDSILKALSSLENANIFLERTILSNSVLLTICGLGSVWSCNFLSRRGGSEVHSKTQFVERCAAERNDTQVNLPIVKSTKISAFDTQVNLPIVKSTKISAFDTQVNLPIVKSTKISAFDTQVNLPIVKSTKISAFDTQVNLPIVKSTKISAFDTQVNLPIVKSTKISAFDTQVNLPIVKPTKISAFDIQVNLPIVKSTKISVFDIQVNLPIVKSTKISAFDIQVNLPIVKSTMISAFDVQVNQPIMKSTKISAFDIQVNLPIVKSTKISAFDIQVNLPIVKSTKISAFSVKEGIVRVVEDNILHVMYCKCCSIFDNIPVIRKVYFQSIGTGGVPFFVIIYATFTELASGVVEGWPGIREVRGSIPGASNPN
ncbi:hypothetical protein ANN_16345 [Periplaneta americana]|uniref:Uncharacterized protein n=1 Tax=Periplaneta americana TaxID=6978 RepID=A0ABQ8SJP6_PERAM|nr:hypothetical protein ANN_16345 [Periplaneta americana]